MKLGQTLLVMGGITLACASLAGGAPVVAGSALAAAGVGLLGRYGVRASTSLPLEERGTSSRTCQLIEETYLDYLKSYDCDDKIQTTGFSEGFGAGFGTAAAMSMLAAGLSGYVIYQKCHKKSNSQSERPLSQLIPMPPVLMQMPHASQLPPASQMPYAVGYDEPDRAASLEPRVQIVGIDRSKNN